MTTDFKPRFVDGKAMQFVGLRKHYTGESMEGMPAQWQAFVAHMNDIPHKVGKVAYGLLIDRPEGIDYMPSVEVSGSGKRPAGFSTTQMPAWKYAVFVHDGDLSTIRNTVDAIWRQWLPKSGHQAVEAGDKPYFFERYGEKFDPQKGQGDIEIWLPIKS